MGIAVLREEGISPSTMKHSDLVAKSIADALNPFSKPKRLMSTVETVKREE